MAKPTSAPPASRGSVGVRDDQSRFTTAFTVSIETWMGVTTGVSALDRITTIRTAIDASQLAETIVSPGHIFPLCAQPGGVLTRRGHTKGSVALASDGRFELFRRAVRIDE